MTLFQQTFVVDSVATTRLERTILSLSPVHNGLHRNQLLGPNDKGSLTIDIASARRPEIGPGQRIDLNIALSATACSMHEDDEERIEEIVGAAVRHSRTNSRIGTVSTLRDAIDAVEEEHRTRHVRQDADEAIRRAIRPFGHTFKDRDAQGVSEMVCRELGIKPPDFLPENPTGFTPSGDPVRDLESIATKLSELQGVETTKVALQALIGRCDHALSRGTPAIGLEAENKARSDRQVTA